MENISSILSMPKLLKVHKTLIVNGKRKWIDESFEEAMKQAIA